MTNVQINSVTTYWGLETRKEINFTKNGFDYTVEVPEKIEDKQYLSFIENLSTYELQESEVRNEN